MDRKAMGHMVSALVYGLLQQIYTLFTFTVRSYDSVHQILLCDVLALALALTPFVRGNQRPSSWILEFTFCTIY